MTHENETLEEFRARVLAGLEQSDKQTREARTDRYVWASRLPPLPPAMIGRFEQIQLMEEARRCYVEGLFGATVIVSFSVIEHSLDEESLFVSGKTSAHKPPKGEKRKYAVALAKGAGTLAHDLIERCDAMREKRNALAHFRLLSDDESDETKLTLVERAWKASKPPQVLLEEDAREALRLAREVFVATLRPFKG